MVGLVRARHFWKAFEMASTTLMSFEQTAFDPTLPLKIRRDKLDARAASDVDEKAMGILASLASATATVLVVRGEYQKVCFGRHLATQSSYFRRRLRRFPSSPQLNLPATIPVEGLDAALKFVETTGVDVTISNLLPILCAASRLEISELQRRLEQYINAIRQLNDSYFLRCWDICRRAPASVPLREEMMGRAVERFANFSVQSEWPLVNSHLVRKLLLRPELKAVPPITLFEAALAWIAGNPHAEPPDVDRIVAAVPFERMYSIDRKQCLAKAAEMQLTSIVAPRVALASWHRICQDSGHPSQSDLPPLESVEIFDESAIMLPTSTEQDPTVSPTASTPLTIEDSGTEGLTSKSEGTMLESESKISTSRFPAGWRKPSRDDQGPGRSRNGHPILFSFVVVATKTRSDGRRATYEDEIVTKKPEE